MQINDYFKRADSKGEVAEALANGRQVLFLGLESSAKATMVEQLVRTAKEKKVLVVANNLLQAERYMTDLETYLPEETVKLFATAESVAADLAISSPEALAERIETLSWLMDEEASGVVVAPVFGLKHRLTPVGLWQALAFPIQVNQELTPTDLTETLVALGYERVDMTLRPGEMSVRGDIVDVYPLNHDQPIRVSLAFDEVERISEYDPSTQKSTSDLEQFTYLPASDFIAPAGQLKRQAKVLKQAVNQWLAPLNDDKVKSALQTVLADEVAHWENGETTDNTRYFNQYIYPETTTLLDYLGKEGVVVIDDLPRLLETETSIEESASLYVQSQVEQGKLPQAEALYTSFSAGIAKFHGRKFYLAKWQRGYGNLSFDRLHQFQTRLITPFYDHKDALKVEFDAWQRIGRQLVVFLSSKDQIRKVQEILAAIDIDAQATTLDQLIPDKVNLVEGTIASGVEWVKAHLVFISEQELFHKQKPRRRRHQLNMSNAERLMSYQELQPGDFVVHVNHGIGKFVGVETIAVNGTHKDYLTIVFADDASIHVPIDQIDLVQKYVSAEGKEPRLNKMGGTEWAKTKQRVQKKIEDIADDLIDLYAEREAEEGYAFSKDTAEQEAFEADFPYVETDDQLRSIKEIKHDMEKDKPMDRLLVGDVGFGKTEVAMRAAFKAMIDGKQVAFLVPTTILAEQHYETLSARFADYPFEIALLNRFRTNKQQQDTIAALKEGSVQLVIGTHRLLSQDVEFLDLGLVIVDEEQRFGVKAKEKLKALKKTVDVLTLTATPIPRTLNMSMLGVRDLSVIETPPANRYPVQTYVMEQNYGAIKDAVEREMARGGQTFYLFNNVQQIQEKAAELEALIPNCSVGIAHGQMTAIQLEDVMQAFLDGEYDLLVTTTIIETGVDMPNVNTLIVENANRMGLSTLYQLRGRVGRSNRVAYAYFMYKPERMLTETSEKRLLALRDFTELGSGFKIAMRDLSIRGAGNLLGAEQHGFVNSVGFDLYTQMLNEAVAKKQGKAPAKTIVPAEIELGIDAYLPSSYIADENQKVEIYKRINQLPDSDAMWDLDAELMDRFGEPPAEVQWLLIIGVVKSAAMQANVKRISRKGQGIEIRFHADSDQQQLTPAIFDALGDLPFRLQMKVDQNELVALLSERNAKTDVWLDHLQQFLVALAEKYRPYPVDEEETDEQKEQR
ncbi:MAG: transcription-repair coupling factor [Aerococcus sp.]|nr:transcription-repair coupling factor [Aerococcus sp.]